MIENKVSKWGEIDIELFKEIFDRYWKRESNTVDKVLEIQNLVAIGEGYPDIRVYFGANIRIEDFEEYNSVSLNIVNSIRNSLGDSFMRDVNLSMCILSDGPRITPLSVEKAHYDLIWYNCFSDPDKITYKSSDFSVSPMTLWYGKTKEELYVPGKDINGSKRYVRLRSWNYSDWRKAIDSYCTDDKFDISSLLPEDDIPVENILYNRKNKENICSA